MHNKQIVQGQTKFVISVPHTIKLYLKDMCQKTYVVKCWPVSKMEGCYDSSTSKASDFGATVPSSNPALAGLVPSFTKNVME